MSQKLEMRNFRKVVWQRDDAKQQQARMVMELMDGIFQDKMIAIEYMGGKTWAPSYPNHNSYDFLWKKKSINCFRFPWLLLKER